MAKRHNQKFAIPARCTSGNFPRVSVSPVQVTEVHFADVHPLEVGFFCQCV